MCRWLPSFPGAVFICGHHFHLWGVTFIRGQLSSFVFMGVHLHSWVFTFIHGHSCSLVGDHLHLWVVMPFVWCRGGCSCLFVGSCHRGWLHLFMGGCAIGGVQWWGVGGVWWPAVGVWWWWVLVAICGGLVVQWCRCCGCVEGPGGAYNSCWFLSSCWENS